MMDLEVGYVESFEKNIDGYMVSHSIDDNIPALIHYNILERALPSQSFVFSSQM